MKAKDIEVANKDCTENIKRKRFRYPVLLKLCFALVIVVLITIIYFESALYGLTLLATFKRTSREPDQNHMKYFIYTQGCKIPNVDPYDELHSNNHMPLQHMCNNDTPALFQANLTSIYMMISSLKYYTNDTKNLKCCYKNYQTKDDKCTEIFDSVNITVESIKVLCIYNNASLVYSETFSFVPLKNINQTVQNSGTPNVLIIGLDGVSRLNLHREMPITVRRLRRLRAVEMMGFHKLGDDTYSNLIPALTGLKAETFLCDNCRFIWQDYNGKGYVTGFAHDGMNFYADGPRKPNVDYWYRNNPEQSGIHDQSCISRSIFTNLLDYSEKFIATMDQNNLSYFGFFWEEFLSRTNLNYGDKYFDNFFENLEKNGHLNNTVLILMSVTNTKTNYNSLSQVERVEQSLPFLWIRIPNWFRTRNIQSYFNLVANAKKLTTPLDLHATLMNLLDPNAFEPKMAFSTKNISLFDRICTDRTCKIADIPKHVCACMEPKTLEKKFWDFRDLVKEIANFAVQTINKNLQEFRERCMKLVLNKVLKVERFVYDESFYKNSNIEEFDVIVSTNPGEGMFETTVRYFITKNKFEVIGRIHRINSYSDNLTYCVTDSDTKKFCYCKKDIPR